MHRLRWFLCKTWGVPVNHEVFQDTTNAQWLWYYYNFIQDREEKFEFNRDMVEYHASFIEPEAVRKIRNAREQSIEVSEDQFMSGLEQIFGHRISDKAERPKNQKMHKADVKKMLSEYKSAQKEVITNGQNYKDWLDMKLE
jgi:DNA-binding transcriptional regulator GbsR (MarR family)